MVEVRTIPTDVLGIEIALAARPQQTPGAATRLGSYWSGEPAVSHLTGLALAGLEAIACHRERWIAETVGLSLRAAPRQPVPNADVQKKRGSGPVKPRASLMFSFWMRPVVSSRIPTGLESASPGLLP